LIDWAYKDGNYRKMGDKDLVSITKSSSLTSLVSMEEISLTSAVYACLHHFMYEYGDMLLH